MKLRTAGIPNLIILKLRRQRGCVDICIDLLMPSIILWSFMHGKNGSSILLRGDVAVVQDMLPFCHIFSLLLFARFSGWCLNSICRNLNVLGGSAFIGA